MNKKSYITNFIHQITSIDNNERDDNLSSSIVGWFILVVSYCIFGIFLVGMRNNFSTLWFIHALIISLIILTSLMNVIYYSRPRPFSSYRLMGLSIASFFLWVVFVCSLPFLQDGLDNFYQFPPKVGLHCLRNIIIFGLVPGVFLILIMKKRYPTKLELTSLFSILLGTMVGVFANHLTCSVEQLFHIVVFHFGPISLVGWGGYFIFSKYMSW